MARQITSRRRTAPAGAAGPVVEVVIIGGGYTGVWAARRVLRARRRLRLPGSVRVTVISAGPAHSFHGWTAEVITGHVRSCRTTTPLAQLLPDARLVEGTVTGVDLDRRVVAVTAPDGDHEFGYHQLIIGVGSRDATDRVPGLTEYGFSVKGSAPLGALSAHLSEVVAAAAACRDQGERTRLLTVVVAGGGFAGAEVSVSIMQRLQRELAALPTRPDLSPRVVLVHSGERLLPGLRPRFDGLADYSVSQARRCGVEVRCGTRLVAVDAAGVTVRPADGSAVEVPTATVVSALGQRPVPIAGLDSLARDDTGRLVTDRHLRVAPDVWAGGDVAAVPHPAGGRDCPANALWAIHHGKRVGANVVLALRQRPARKFRFPGLGQAASFGVGRGAGELYGVPLRGWTAWLARWVFFHWFMPSRKFALLTAGEWMLRR